MNKGHGISQIRFIELLKIILNDYMKYIFSVLFLFSIVSSVFSQVSDEKGESQFMNSILMSREQSYITVLGGLGNIKPLISEAAVVPYYMIHLNQSRWGIDLSTKIVMRMFRERSAPIRTPSYMPRIIYRKSSNCIDKQLYFNRLKRDHPFIGMNNIN